MPPYRVLATSTAKAAFVHVTVNTLERCCSPGALTKRQEGNLKSQVCFEASIAETASSLLIFGTF